MKNIILLVVCSLLVFCTANALAQTANVLEVDYFANANTAGAPDATMRLDDPGDNGKVCAAIFVFDPQAELSECCSCLLTPDGLRTLSVNVDLTSNPVTGVTLTTGAIRVVSTRVTPGPVPCPQPTTLTGTQAPLPQVRSWVTHIASNFGVKETGSQDATLYPGEQAALASQCAAISKVGSGKGVCTCGSGD